jgi:hypothetical protein
VLFLSLVLAFQKSENLDSAYGAVVALVGIPFLLRGAILIATISITVMASWHRGRERLNRKLARRWLSHNHENGPGLAGVPDRFLPGRIMPPWGLDFFYYENRSWIPGFEIKSCTRASCILSGSGSLSVSESMDWEFSPSRNHFRCRYRFRYRPRTLVFRFIPGR